MIKKCMSCHKEWPMDDPKPGISHGFCPRTDPLRLSDCAMTWVAWSEIPVKNRTMSLHDFWKSLQKKVA